MFCNRPEVLKQSPRCFACYFCILLCLNKVEMSFEDLKPLLLERAPLLTEDSAAEH